MLFNILTPVDSAAEYASNFVEGVDMAFYVIIGISIFFLVGITAAMIYFIFKYDKKRHPKAEDLQDNMKLELLWTIIPTILVIGMFYYGWAGWERMDNFPDNAMEVDVTGRMWSWQFDYPNGKLETIQTGGKGGKFVLPVNKPVILNLHSPDVIHAFYVPAFRVKQDVTPAVNNRMWFKPTKIGEYDLFCAEYCGTNHSGMIGKVKIISQADFDKWYAEKESVPDNEHPGYTLLKKNACIACHSTDGSKRIGPTFKGIIGATKTVLTSGDERTLTVDKAYIIKSIDEPNADVVKNFKANMMSSYKGKLSEKDYNDIYEYFETLK